MNTFHKILIAGAGVVGGNEYIRLQQRLKQREVKFKEASQHAQRLQKPLLVIGRPDGWTSDRTVKKWDTTWWEKGAHPCGDITVDVRPPAGNKCPNYISTSAANLGMISSGSIGAIFSSCTLEHIDDLPKAYSEMKRVLDPKGQIFAIVPQRWSLFAWLFPHHKWIIDQVSAENIEATPIRQPATQNYPALSANKTLTPKDIHQKASSLGIKWDNDPRFMAWTKRLTGKSHLDDMDQKQLFHILVELGQRKSSTIAQ